MKSPMASTKFLEPRIRALWNFDDPEASLHAMNAEAEVSAEPERSIWLTQVARALGLAGRFEEARDLLHSIESQENHHLQARLAIEEGRVINSNGDPARARPYFEIALNEADAAGTQGLAVDAIHMLAIVAESTSEAKRLNEEALARAESSEDPDARRWRASVLNNLGWTHHDAGLFEQALRCFELALAIREEEGEAKPIAYAREAVADARLALPRDTLDD